MFIALIEFLKKIPGWLYAVLAAIVGFLLLILRIVTLNKDNKSLEQQVETAVVAEKSAERSKEVVQEVLVAKTEEADAIRDAAITASNEKEAVEQEVQKQRVKINTVAAQIPPQGSSVDDVVAAFNKSHHND